MTLTAGVGFAVANGEDEHKALTAAGYGPAFVAPETADAQGRTLEQVRAELDAAGIVYDRRQGIAKLLALLPA